MYEHDQNVARGLCILKKLLIAYLQFKCNQASWGRHYFYFILFFSFFFQKNLSAAPQRWAQTHNA